MKCPKCGDIITVHPGKSVNFCSNCGERIQIPPKPSTNNVIKALVMQHSLGDGLFLEPSILSSFASDILRNNDEEALERIELAIFKKCRKSCMS